MSTPTLISLSFVCFPVRDLPKFMTLFCVFFFGDSGVDDDDSADFEDIFVVVQKHRRRRGGSQRQMERKRRVSRKRDVDLFKKKVFMNNEING